MQLVDLIKLLVSLRKLSKVNKNWVEVKRVYILCIKLIISITITRYLTEGLMCCFLIIMVINLVMHPLIFPYFVASGLYTFTDNILHFSKFNERHFLS